MSQQAGRIELSRGDVAALEITGLEDGWVRLAIHDDPNSGDALIVAELCDNERLKLIRALRGSPRGPDDAP